MRERRDDILWFARAFLGERSRATGVARRLSVAAESALLSHSWPENVRELRHAIERACILSMRAVIEPGDLFEAPATDTGSVAIAGDASLSDYLERCERYFILDTEPRVGVPDGAADRGTNSDRERMVRRSRNCTR